MFEPRELGAELELQLFSKAGVGHWEPYWVEMNGHALNLYECPESGMEAGDGSFFLFFFAFFLLLSVLTPLLDQIYPEGGRQAVRAV